MNFTRQNESFRPNKSFGQVGLARLNFPARLSGWGLKFLNKYYRITYKFILGFLTILLLGQKVLGFYLSDVESKYSDVDKFDKYYPSIIYFTDREVVEGYPDGNFASSKEVNRVEALKMILLASNFEIVKNEAASKDLKYQDINAEEWYFPFLSQATDFGIIEGYPNGNFYPEKTINLAEALKMIFYANNLSHLPQPKTDPAVDIPKNEWYADEVYYSIERDIIWPSSSWEIYPAKNLSRGELLDLLYKFLLKDNQDEITYTGKATYYSDIFNGKGTASGEVFNQELYTAAHRFFDFGTILTVVNLENGATVEVKVNDRGPYTEGYSLDLSSSAFEAISPLSRGVIDIFYFMSE